MRYKSEDLKQRILAFIRDFYISKDRTPSTTEIAQEFGIARSTSQNYLVAMDRDGMLSYQGGKLNADQLRKLMPDRIQVPMVGTVPCGELTYEEENVECVTTLPTAIFGSGPFYILHAFGDSMEDEGIEEGDLVVIRQTSEAQIGDLVIAMDADGLNTLKKYAGVDPENGKATLQYCNRTVYGDRVILVDKLICQGVVSHVIKQKKGRWMN